MLRFLLKSSLLITLVFTVAGLIIHKLGGHQPLNSALRGFAEGCEDKPQPCWHGIVPAQTTSDEAAEILTSLGYNVTEMVLLSGGGLQMRALLPDRPDCLPTTGLAYPDSKILFALSISLCEPVTLVDVIKQFGMPDVADEPFTLGCNLRLVFADSFMQLSIHESIQLSAPVQVINLYSKGTNVVHPTVVSWIGPISIAAYQKQLHVRPCH